MWTPSWSLGLWAVSTTLFVLSYNAVGRAFPYKDSSTRQTELAVTREYRAVNVVKGVVLAVCCPAGAVVAASALYGPPYAGGWLWNTWLPAMGALYAATDLSAIFYNPQASWTTQLHHTLVQVFYLYLEWLGFAPTSTARAIVLYAGISSCEFLVNLRLAARRMLRGQASVWLNRAALWNYLIGTYINVCGQIWLFWTLPNTTSLSYCGVLLAMAGVFADDLRLIDYLWRWSPGPSSRPPLA